MSAADAPGGGGIGDVIRAGFGIAGAINRALGVGVSPEQQRAYDAASSAGYTYTAPAGRAVVGGYSWTDPAGNPVGKREVLRAGRQLQQTPSSPGEPGQPGQPGAPGQPGSTSWPAAPSWSPGLAWAWDVRTGPRTRRRKRKRKRKLGQLDMPGPWRPPSTDAEYEDFWRETGIDQADVRKTPAWGWEGLERGFAPGTWKKPPDWNVIARPGSVFGRVLGGVAGVLATILWPTPTASDDVLGWPVPSKGPRRRPRVGRAPEPQAWPQPDPLPQPQPQPVPTPSSWPMPTPSSWPVPTPSSWPLPGPTTLPRVPTPTPTPSSPLPFDPLWFALPQLLRPPQLARPRQPHREPDLVPDPLTAPQPQPVPFRTNNCPPCDCTKRKRKRDSCTNPISSKRTFTRGSTRYRTITRKLQCQV